MEIAPRAGARSYFSFNDVLNRLANVVKAQNPHMNPVKLYTYQSYYRGFLPFIVADLSLLYVTIGVQRKMAEFYMWMRNHNVQNVEWERYKIGAFVYTTSVLFGTAIFTPLRGLQTRLVATIDMETREVKNKSGRKVLSTSIYQPSFKEICMRPGLWRGGWLVMLHVGFMNGLTLGRLFNQQ